MYHFKPLSSKELEHMQTSSDKRLSDCAFRLASHLEGEKILTDALEEAIKWAKRVPSKAPEPSIVAHWENVLLDYQR